MVTKIKQPNVKNPLPKFYADDMTTAPTRVIVEYRDYLNRVLKWREQQEQPK